MDIVKETKEEKYERLSSWIRNVRDCFKDKTNEEIKQKLRSTCFPFSCCFLQVHGDFNIGTGIRNANAFNCDSVYYLGIKKFDRRGTVGVQNYTDIKYLKDFQELVDLKKEYLFVAVDNIGKPKSLELYNWGGFSKKVLMIFGEEGVGISNEVLNICDEFVEIPMFGSVRSLNVGTASGIVMNDFVTKFRKNLV